MEFVTPLWFAAVGAVALPVALHLIRRERFKRCEIATLRFLAAAVRERGGRQRITNWPLLLVRALALIALAVLLSRPFRTASEPSVPVGADTLILCDVSGSQARLGGAELDDTVRKQITQLPPDVQVTVAQFADKVDVAPDSTRLAAIPGANTDINRAVDWAIDYRVKAGGQPGRVILISDFPKPVVRTLSPRLWPAGTEVQFVPTRKEGAWNLGIERVELLTPVAAANVTMEVHFASGGPLPREDAIVRLNIEGHDEVLEQTLKAGQTRAQFQWKSEIPAEGLLLRGSAEVVPTSGDAIPADNSRPFAFPVARQRSVLLVDGDPGESIFAGETYFLEKALQSVKRADEVALFRTTMRPRPGDLSGFDVVALCNLPALTSTEAHALGNFVAGGGSLLLTAGGKTQPSLFDALASVGITFGRVTPAQAPTPRPSVISAPDHLALQRIAGEAQEDWKNLLFSAPLNLKPAASAKTLVATEDGAPLLVEASTGGEGRALAFLHSIDREESEFPRDPLFVPWAREIFRYLARASNSPWIVREVMPNLDERREAGVYLDGNKVTVVSAAPEEIDITPASLDELRSLILASPVATEHGSASPAALTLQDGAPRRLRPHEWWPVAALVLFAFLVMESLLSARGFARR